MATCSKYAIDDGSDDGTLSEVGQQSVLVRGNVRLRAGACGWCERGERLRIDDAANGIINILLAAWSCHAAVGKWQKAKRGSRCFWEEQGKAALDRSREYTKRVGCVALRPHTQGARVED